MRYIILSKIQFLQNNLLSLILGVICLNKLRKWHPIFFLFWLNIKKNYINRILIRIWIFKTGSADTDKIGPDPQHCIKWTNLEAARLEYISAIFAWMSWNSPILCPNWVRSWAYLKAMSQQAYTIDQFCRNQRFF